MALTKKKLIAVVQKALGHQSDLKATKVVSEIWDLLPHGEKTQVFAPAKPFAKIIAEDPVEQEEDKKKARKLRTTSTGLYKAKFHVKAKAKRK